MLKCCLSEVHFRGHIGQFLLGRDCALSVCLGQATWGNWRLLASFQTPQTTQSVYSVQRILTKKLSFTRLTQDIWLRAPFLVKVLFMPRWGHFCMNTNFSVTYYWAHWVTYKNKNKKNTKLSSTQAKYMVRGPSITGGVCTVDDYYILTLCQNLA